MRSVTQSTLGNNINKVPEKAIVVQNHGSTKNQDKTMEFMMIYKETLTCIANVYS